MSFSLRLFGGLALSGPAGPVTGPAAQRHRLALLALLAVGRSRAVSRDKLLAWLWPERETESARRLLNQAVHAVRQALGAEVILSAGEDLQLDTAVVQCDVVRFEEALAAGATERAVELYGGPFLDGFFLDEAPEFERWVDRERDRLAGAWAKALEGLAQGDERAGHWGAAVERWRARAGHDPYDSRIALRLMEALERAGNRAGALQHALQHQQLLRAELDIEPPDEIHAMVERLRREAPSPASRRPLGSAELAAPASPASGTATRAASQTTIRPPRPLLRYAAAAVLLAAAGGGAIRLAARNDRPPAATAADVDQIAKAVARELSVRERGDTGRREPQQRTTSLAAYEAYLRGNDPAVLRSDSAARRGLEHFQRAVSLDSSYAAAWLGLARMTVRTAVNGPAHATVLDTAETYVRRALALDDSLAEGHAVLAMLRAMVFDFAAAEAEFRKAMSLEPRGRPRELFVQFLLMTERPADALAEAERVIELDPLSPSAIAELARALAANGRCTEALQRLKAIESLDPPLLRAPPIAARCYAREGRWDDGIAVLRPQVARDSGSLALVGYLEGRAGRRPEALAIQARLMDLRARRKVPTELLAYVPASLGDHDQTFAWLDSALAEGSLRFAPGRQITLSELPYYEELARDPRMMRLRRALGLRTDSAARTGADTPTPPDR